MNNEVNIILQVINGNTGAYKLLVDAYKDLVFSLVIKIVRNREVAEEVAQDVFLKAYHSLGNFKNEQHLSSSAHLPHAHNRILRPDIKDYRQN